MISIAPQGNRREVPPGVPPAYWLGELRDIVNDSSLVEIPWVHPWMEYLSPDELARLRAQAVIWHHHQGEWPTEIAYWWPVRLARRRGGFPQVEETVSAVIDERGTLKCGFCNALWSANDDGSPHPDRCKLCDRQWNHTKMRG